MRLNWGTGIALAYTVFAVATMGFAVFAMDQKVELVSEDYYQRAMHHDDRMAAVANAEALGRAFRLDADDRQLTLTWTTARPDRGAGTVTLYRPSDAGADRSIPLDPDASGAQRIALAGLAPGRWLVQVQWRAGERQYYVERTLVRP